MGDPFFPHELGFHCPYGLLSNTKIAVRQRPKHVMYGPCLTLHNYIIHCQLRLVIVCFISEICFYCDNISRARSGDKSAKRRSIGKSKREI